MARIHSKTLRFRSGYFAVDAIPVSGQNPPSMIDWTDTLARLAAWTRIAVFTHERPDGDAIGSSIGLVRLLRAAGRQAWALDLGPFPDRYAFLYDPDEQAASDTLGPDAVDGLIVLDCGALDRAPPAAATWIGQRPSINIDHHLSNTGFATVNAVDTAASSVGELICRLADAASYPLTPTAAIPLWTAIVTDTGRFAYDSTSPETLRAAARLLEQGIPASRLDHTLFQAASETRLRLEAHAMVSLQTAADGTVAWITLRQADFAALGAAPVDTEDLVNIPRRLPTAVVAIFFCELPDAGETKVSVRTRPPCDAAALCRRFDGGGHARAAGCTLAGDADAARTAILAALRENGFPSADLPVTSCPFARHDQDRLGRKIRAKD